MSNYYLTDNNRSDAIKNIIDNPDKLKGDDDYKAMVLNICSKYVQYKSLTDKQEAVVARAYYYYYYVKPRTVSIRDYMKKDDS